MSDFFNDIRKERTFHEGVANGSNRTLSLPLVVGPVWAECAKIRPT
jgi:hypothetical protein